MLEIFRFIKLLPHPSNVIQRNATLRLMSSGLKTPSENADLKIRGGTKCVPKEKTPAPEAEAKAEKKETKKKSCEELLMEKDDKTKQKNKDPTAISGGGSQKVCFPKPKTEPPMGEHTSRWRKISMYMALPLIAILTLLVFTTRTEGERPEFIYYPHLYKRSKPYFFADGNRTAFHNEHWNALPPAGYKDEVDDGAAGQTPETEEEKKLRLKEFEKTRKLWDKHTQKREKERKKEEEKAKKEQIKETPVETQGIVIVAEEEKKELVHTPENPKKDADDQMNTTKVEYRFRNKQRPIYNVMDEN